MIVYFGNIKIGFVMLYGGFKEGDEIFYIVEIVRLIKGCEYE